MKKWPNIALIVLNKCCELKRQSKNEQTKPKKEKKKKKSTIENIIELEEPVQTPEITELSKDETQWKNSLLVYTYEFLDDQFLLNKWQEGERK